VAGRDVADLGPRRGVHESADARVEDLRAQVSASYVPAGGPSARVVDTARRGALVAWLDTLLPGDEHWPPASAAGAADHVDATAHAVPALRGPLLGALDSLGTAAAEREHAASFEELSATARADLVASLDAGPHRLIAAIVWELACEAYYRDPTVLATLDRRTGFGAAQATVGWELERFTPELVTSVAERPATYVQVPS
jgi:hypothetical protein